MSEKNLTEQVIELLHTHHLLSAREMLRRLQEISKTYNKTSVYRAIEHLLDRKILCRHYFEDGEAHYELREHHHAHLYCTQCKRVFFVDCMYPEPLNIDGFQPDHHHVTVYGLCTNCDLV